MKNQTYIIDLNECIDRQPALETAAYGFFHYKVKGRLRKEEREDIFAAALELIWKFPYKPGTIGRYGKAVSVELYFENLLNFAYLSWRDDRQIRELYAADFGEPLQSSDFENCNPDAVSSIHCKWAGQNQLLAFLGQDDDICTPPYEVVFPETVQVSEYRYNRFYVPDFAIKPRVKGAKEDVIGLRKENGRMHRIYPQMISDELVQTLEETKNAFCQCVKDMIPEYLNDYGWQSLSFKLRGVLSDYNKGLPPRTIQTKRKISRKQYEVAMRQLVSRGFLKTYVERDARVKLLYNPVFDGQRSLFRLDAALQIESLPFPDMMGMVEGISERAIRTGYVKNKRAIRKELHSVRERLIDHKMDMVAEGDYHKNLCNLIRAIIERPTFGKGMELCEVDTFVASLPVDRQKQLIFDAIARRVSVIDLMSLADYHPSVYRARDTETLASMM